LRLELRSLASLRPHEETTESSTKRLASELSSDGVQKDPLIIDADTGVVLDGMHRLAALKLLGLRSAACTSVDYSSDSVAVGRWLRVFHAMQETKALEILEDAGIMETTSMDEGINLLQTGECSLLAVGAGSVFIAGERRNLEEAFSMVRSLDSAALNASIEREFVDEGLLRTVRPSADVTVVVPPIAKADVLRAAQTGKLFPCKTSMHAIEPRPVGLGIPLSELEAGTAEVTPLDGVYSELLPPDSLYGGRKYRERLMILRRK